MKKLLKGVGYLSPRQGSRFIASVGWGNTAVPIERPHPSTLTCLQLFHDSAGKFCPDKWTRKGEEGRVEKTADEEVPHEDEKEDQDVAARSTARTHTRTNQPDRSREFSEGDAGDASAGCTRLNL